MICPRCTTPTHRDHIGAGHHQREVQLCTTCWTTWPPPHLTLINTRRDLE